MNAPRNNIWCWILGHKRNEHETCRRCGHHGVAGFTPPEAVMCQCPFCPGQLRYDGFNTTRAFLVCNHCKCCYHAKNSTDMMEVRRGTAG